MSRGMRQLNLTYSTKEAAAGDLVAAVSATIPAGGWEMVATTLMAEELELARQPTTAALVVPRSGLAYNNGITVLNAPGLIDPDYTGRVGVILHNISNQDYSVSKGDRIAQLMLVPFKRVYGAPVVSKERGEGGYGSTGK